MTWTTDGERHFSVDDFPILGTVRGFACTAHVSDTCRSTTIAVAYPRIPRRAPATPTPPEASLRRQEPA
jgi:hypothetical protein